MEEAGAGEWDDAAGKNSSRLAPGTEARLLQHPRIRSSCFLTMDGIGCDRMLQPPAADFPALMS